MRGGNVTRVGWDKRTCAALVAKLFFPFIIIRLRDRAIIEVLPMQRGEMDPVTSPSLLLRIRNADDSESWREFDSVYAPVVRAYCRRRGFQATDIDDIAQEVMAAVANAIRKFEYEPDKGRFRSWLATITANKLRNFVLKNNSGHAQLSEIVDQLAQAPDSDSEWSTIFLQQVFQSACERIQATCEPQTWQCFEATWIDDLPANEVAEQFKMPIHSVYVNKSRVLKRLEQEFLMLSDDFPMAELKRTS